MSGVNIIFKIKLHHNSNDMKVKCQDWKHQENKKCKMVIVLRIIMLYSCAFYVKHATMENGAQTAATIVPTVLMEQSVIL